MKELTNTDQVNSCDPLTILHCTALTGVCREFEFLIKAFLMSFATFLGGVKLILVKLASIKQMCNLILYSQCSGAEETRSDRAS